VACRAWPPACSELVWVPGEDFRKNLNLVKKIEAPAMAEKGTPNRLALGRLPVLGGREGEDEGQEGPINTACPNQSRSCFSSDFAMS
jgi:hypothetical protein